MSRAASAIAPTDPARVGDADAAMLARSRDHCRAVTRRCARNFYYGLRLTPEPRRSAVYAVYAWMRRADDLVDDPGHVAERRARLADLAHRTESALRGQIPDDPGGEGFWPALAWTLRAFPIDPAWLRAMLDGMREDLDHAGYDTPDHLDRYCDRVASTVGLVCVAIWGLRPGADADAAREMAIARGRAFQLTNILRDIAHDFDESPPRVYVPRDVLARHGLTAQRLRAWADPVACTALVLDLADLARRRYDASAGLEDLIDPACAPAMWGMTRIYRGLLDAITREPHRVAGPGRIRLSSWTKGLIAVRALVRTRLASPSAPARAAEPAP